MSFFWLDKHVKLWNAAISHNHKPQAVIVSGSHGIGKVELLQQIVADLICRQVESGHCGHCQPDIHDVKPEKNVIKVKMIRELTEFFTSTPHCSDYKIAVINQADCMNVAAANALLKVLEEPPARGILFLLTDSKHQLMPTIKSRCISLDVVLRSSEKTELNIWLKERLSDEGFIVEDQLIQNALDGLFQAFNQETSVSSVAKQMIETSTDYNWALLQRYCLQLLKSNFNPKQHEIFVSHPLNQLIKKSPKVVHVIIEMTELIQQFMLNLNTQVKAPLLLESLLVEIKSELSDRS